jgi:hypothetical protein
MEWFIIINYRLLKKCIESSEIVIILIKLEWNKSVTDIGEEYQMMVMEIMGNSKNVKFIFI